MPSKVCLCMIERDESRVLPRSLKSFLALGDAGCDLSYAIVDGGSEDDSVKVIKETMEGVKGEVAVVPQPKPLDDFSAARNAAIELGRPLGDWLFMLDADDEIILEPGFHMPDLDAFTALDGFAIKIRFGPEEFYRPALVRASSPWRFEDEIHEHIECPGGKPCLPLKGIHILVHPGQGARSVDPKQKFMNDAAACRRGLERKPGDPRLTFYLAQSYRDAGELAEALKVYEERGRMLTAWVEETFFALLQVARIKASLEYPLPDVMDAYLASFNIRPCRAEPLGFLAEYLRLKGHYASAVYFAQMAMKIPFPNDVLFVGRDWYDWRAEDEFAVSCYYVGDPGTSKVACNRLIANPNLPEAQRKRIENNLTFCDIALAQLNPQAAPDLVKV